MGKDVPAVGISLGFERVVDLITKQFDSKPSLVLIYEDIHNALNLQKQAIEEGYDARIEKRVKNIKSLLESMGEQGYENFALTEDEQMFTRLDIKPLS
jgi:histidyl-tRNA synthetase